VQAGKSQGKTGKRTASLSDELGVAEAYVSGRRETYRQVDNWINQVTRLSIWHFVEAIEDVNSVVHLKLYSALKAGKFRGESTFRTYVQRIARYTCIDQVRSQRVKREADDEDLPRPADTDRPDEVLEQRERDQIFVKIFRAIGADCQRLWRMIFSESLNYKEIGEKLGMPEGTVKRRVHECKKAAIELKNKMI
jgi:RNA polymerase sigma factor (sigma-70 family)